MKKLFKNKKGMNCLETAILVIALLSLIIMYTDVLIVSQKMTATTAVSNYISRTIERQGGILNYVPTNFATYGHGSYTTSENAYKIINKNLEQTFGADALGRVVDIKIKLVQSDGMGGSGSGVEILDFSPSSCFGIYLGGGKGDFNEDSPGFISTRSMKYYKPYYIVYVTMKYDMWVLPAVLKENPTHALTKTFTRVVVPSYYIQEENYNSSNTNNENFFVV